jgi:hypothetical protein
VVVLVVAIGLAIKDVSSDLGGPLGMAAAVGTLAGLFFGAWAGFVFKGHALEELDRNIPESSSSPGAHDRST